MNLVIKDPFTARRVNRALVGRPRYLPSSRMWLEKIEFKGLRWSLKWPVCRSHSHTREEPDWPGHWAGAGVWAAAKGAGDRAGEGGGVQRHEAGCPSSARDVPPSPRCLAKDRQSLC